MFKVLRFGNSNFLNQFERLPKSFTDENKNNVLITRCGESTDTVTINASKAVYPYDVFVTSKLEEMPIPSVVSKELRYICFNRYPKAVQGMMLKQFFDKIHIASSYYHLNTYQAEGTKVSLDLPKDLYVIKPENGARSLAIIEINTAKISMEEFFNKISRVADKTEKEQAKLSSSKKEVDGEQLSPEPTNLRNKYFMEVIEATGAKFVAGEENYDGEAIDQFFQQQHTIQVKCPMEFIELRAIRSMKGNLLIVTREDLNANWTGSTKIVTKDNFDKVIKNSSSTPKTNILDDITEALSHPDFPGMYGSIDIWVSAYSNTWGIFEFQPQYNGENIPADVHYKFMRNCISEFISIAE